ncbi:MAG: universal stress protein [Desulfobacterales bacterium]|jgi:nucleotide-binding universal stress UspA family protein
MEFKKILVPVDGSQYATRAASAAADLAGSTGAEIILVHCHKAFPALLGEPYYQSVVSRILKDANDLLEPYRKLLAKRNIAFTERLLEGPPRQAVADVAKHENCDLIVIGSRGLSDLEGLFLGSVTHRVLRVAPCPVMVIR